MPKSLMQSGTYDQHKGRLTPYAIQGHPGMSVHLVKSEAWISASQIHVTFHLQAVKE